MSSQLAPAEQEKLNEFQVITSFGDEDYDKVVSLLRNNYWNLEVALSKYFDGHLEQEAARDLQAESDTQEPSTRAQQQFQAQQINDAFQQPPHFEFNEDPFQVQSPPDFASLGLLPQLTIVKPLSNRWKSQPGLPSKRVTSVFGSFYESPLLFILLLLPRALTFLLSTLGGIIDWIFPSSPDFMPKEPTLQEFNFEAKFRELTQDAPPFQFFEGEFNDALNIAKLENKFLLLTLIGDSELSNSFVKKILNNSQVNALIKEEEIIVYGGNVNEPQSFEIARNLSTKTTPSVYLIANVSSGPNGIASMSVLSKIPIKSLATFTTRLHRELERYKPEIIIRRAEQEELNYARQIRELQDKAYEDSLTADKIKKEAKEKQEALLKEKNERELFLKKNKLLFYKYLKTHKFNNDTNEELANLEKGEFSIIRFKLPSGENLTQRFSANHTLSDLYHFIDLELHLKSLSEGELEEFHQLEGELHPDYTHGVKFELISPFPRYTVENNEKLIKDVKQIWPNGSLLIEFTAEDEDEDDEEVGEKE